MTGVALRLWHGSLARRRKTVVLITDECRRARQPCGTRHATSRAAAGDVGAHCPLLGIVESSLRRGGRRDSQQCHTHPPPLRRARPRAWPGPTGPCSPSVSSSGAIPMMPFRKILGGNALRVARAAWENRSGKRAHFRDHRLGREAGTCGDRDRREIGLHQQPVSTSHPLTAQFYRLRLSAREQPDFQPVRR